MPIKFSYFKKTFLSSGLIFHIYKIGILLKAFKKICACLQIHIYAGTRQREGECRTGSKFVRWIFPLPWAPEIEFRPPGLHGIGLYLLSILAAPNQDCQFVEFLSSIRRCCLTSISTSVCLQFGNLKFIFQGNFLLQKLE